MRRIHWLFVLSLVMAVSLGSGGCDPSEAPGDDAADPRRNDTALATPTPEEPPAPRSGSAARAVVLGTSLTAGYGLDDPERDAWPGRLQWMADSAGLDVTVVGAGVSGGTSAGGVRLIDWVLRQPLDVLVLELGANDGLRGQDLAALEANLREILTRTRDRYPGARLAVIQMEAPTNMGREYTAEFRDVFGRVAEDEGATLVPFILDGVAGVPSLNQEDGIHPTPEGHDAMARNAWPWLEPLLRDAVGPPASR